MAAIDRISDPRVKKERKLYAGKKWRGGPPEPADCPYFVPDFLKERGAPSFTHIPFYVDGEKLGYIDFRDSRFSEDEFFVWLEGASKFIVVRVVDEEGYVPPAPIDFGPAKTSFALDLLEEESVSTGSLG